MNRVVPFTEFELDKKTNKLKAKFTRRSGLSVDLNLYEGTENEARAEMIKSLCRLEYGLLIGQLELIINNSFDEITKTSLKEIVTNLRG